jgi:hypothetical protein
MIVNRNSVKRVISQLILTHKDKVVNAMHLSDIKVDDKMSDDDIYTLIMENLKRGNPKLILNLGYVFDDTVDMSQIAQPKQEKSSDFLGFGKDKNEGSFGSNSGTSFGGGSSSSSPSWWSQNSGSVITAGVGLLGNLFGKKDNPPSVAPPSNSGNDAMMMMLQQQQAQAQKDAREDRLRREEADKRRSQNMMILGIVGGIVVIGGIVAIVVTKK